MSLSTTQYGFIIDPMVPFTDASGTTIRNGYVRVFVAGSSTPVITYKNYDGATNEETIQLDNSGRTAYPVIVSKGNTYKVCVYDAEHSQESPILTIDKVVPAGANVEATNIVTGLDNVESPEAGWVKSTVSGTDAEVSLDATNVTSEVDTMVKATAASADYMMPLVHKTGSDPDKKITLGNIFKFVLNFIHSLTDTATESDIVSGNYFALDGSAGTKKLNSTTLLTKTAQNALAGNVAQEFDPTRTSENPYKAGESVLYTDGKIYTFKVDHYGAWAAADVRATNCSELFATGDAQNCILEEGFYDTHGATLPAKTEDSSYICCKIQCETGDKFFVVGSGTSYARLWATADEYGNIVRRADSNTTAGISDKLVISIESSEKYFVYSSEKSLVGVPRFVRRMNVNEVVERLSSTTESLYKNVVDYKDFVYHFVKAAGSSGSLSFYYTPKAGEKVFTLLKTQCISNTWALYYNDSTGTNPNKAIKTDAAFGENLVAGDLPTGYNRLLVYSYGSTTTDKIDVALYSVDSNSIKYRVEILEQDTSSLKSGLNNVSAKMNKNADYLGKITHAAGTSARLSLFITPNQSVSNILVVKNAGPQVKYDLYANDSTGVNSNIVVTTDNRFGEVVNAELPSGYDRFLIFSSGSTTEFFEFVAYDADFLLGQIAYIKNSQLPYSGKKILCFGDSITQFVYNNASYTDFLSDLSGASVVNCGVGGTAYALRTDVTTTPSTSTQAWASLDMYNLVHSWINNDWTAVDAGVQWLTDNESRGYLADIVTRLKNTSINEIDVITLFAGTNDFSFSTPVGSVNNNNAKTILGALSLIVKELYTAKPSLKIFIFSPLVRWYGYDEDRLPENFSDTYVRNGITLKQLSADIVQAGADLHIPTLDFYNTLGWNMWNFSNYFNDNDGTHPYKGFENLAKRMNAFITANVN